MTDRLADRLIDRVTDTLIRVLPPSKPDGERESIRGAAFDFVAAEIVIHLAQERLIVDRLQGQDCLPPGRGRASPSAERT